jgi:hypothetical protein
MKTKQKNLKKTHKKENFGNHKTTHKIFIMFINIQKVATQTLHNPQLKNPKNPNEKR